MKEKIKIYPIVRKAKEIVSFIVQQMRDIVQEREKIKVEIKKIEETLVQKKEHVVKLGGKMLSLFDTLNFAYKGTPKPKPEVKKK